MTVGGFRRNIADRRRRRAVFPTPGKEFGACITLSAPGAAPIGLGSTGDPVFAAAGSMVGVPALSVPVLDDGGLALGLQLLGFSHHAASLFATARRVLAVL